MTELGEIVKAGGKSNSLAVQIEANKKHFERALGKAMDVEKFVRTVHTQMRTIPHLPECTFESVFGGALLAAQSGLSLNSVQGHAWLVPFYSSTKKCFEAQFILGYRGLTHLAWNSGRVKDISAREVHENDRFDYAYGLRDSLVHKPARSDRGEVTDYYAVARFVGGGHVFTVMTVEEVEHKKKQALAKAKNPNNPELPWNKWFDQMAKKSCVLSMKSWLPMSAEAVKVVEADEAVVNLTPDSEEAWDLDYPEVIDTEGEEQ